MGLAKRTPYQRAEAWYSEAAMKRYLSSPECKIPRDTKSPEFATWLTEQYRLAMAKGIQLGGEIDC